MVRSTRCAKEGIDISRPMKARIAIGLSGKQFMGLSQKKFIDHYNNPRNVGSFDKNASMSAPESSAPPSAAT